MLGEPTDGDIRWAPGGADMAAHPPIVEVWPLSETSLSDWVDFKSGVGQTPVFEDPMMGSNNSFLADMGCGHCPSGGNGMSCCETCAMRSASLTQSVPSNGMAMDPGNGSFAVAGLSDAAPSRPKGGHRGRTVLIGLAMLGLGYLALKRFEIL